MNNLFRLMVTEERYEEMLTYTFLVILITVIAAAVLLALTFLILPRLGRKVTVVRKHRDRSDGQEVLTIECTTGKKRKPLTLICDSSMTYDKMKNGSIYSVVIKDGHIVKVNLNRERKWRRK